MLTSKAPVLGQVSDIVDIKILTARNKYNECCMSVDNNECYMSMDINIDNNNQKI